MAGWRKPTLILGLVLLYLGVIATGMSLRFFPAAALATAILLSYNLLMRPIASWAPNPPLLILSITVLAVMASALVGFGALLSGWLPAPGPVVGPAMMLAGVALSRLTGSAKKAEELDAVLTDAIAQINIANRDSSADDNRHVPQPERHEAEDEAAEPGSYRSETENDIPPSARSVEQEQASPSPPTNPHRPSDPNSHQS